MISLHWSTVNDVNGDEAGIFNIIHVEIISVESRPNASANSLTLNLADLKTINFNASVRINLH